MLEHLKPSSNKHSISRAIATIYIAQPLLKPEIIFEKINQKKQDFLDYQKKSLSHVRTLNFNFEENILSQKDDHQINGFLFESFDERGQLKNIFSLQNGDGNAKTTLSFDCRLYERWDDFLAKLQKDFNTIGIEYNFFVEAISLAYVDEFDWKSESKISINEIFDANSEYVNNKFLSSENGSISLLSQTNQNKYITEEKADISFSNTVKKIIIAHHYAKQFPNLEVSKDFLVSDMFTESFTEAHIANKDFLRNLLTQPVKELIKLN